MWQPYYVEWEFLVAINITCTVGIFWGLTNTDLSFFSIFFLNPFTAEPPVTTRADPHPQLVSSILCFASNWERTPGTRLPRPFYRLWRHQFWWSRTTLSSNFWRVKRSFTPYDNEHDSVKKTGEKVAWLPGSEIVELRKCEHLSFFLFPAPQTFRVPFTFASSPLSESLEQARGPEISRENLVPSPSYLSFHLILRSYKLSRKRFPPKSSQLNDCPAKEMKQETGKAEEEAMRKS